METVSAVHNTPDGLFASALNGDDEPGTQAGDSPTLSIDSHGHYVAENGSYYGQVSDTTDRPKVVFVNGYFRKDGTYVRSHYRSLPIGATTARGPPYFVYTSDNDNTAIQPRIAENGSYYGQLNDSGVPKTVRVNGYYRKDGTYVKGHYRSRPRR